MTATAVDAAARAARIRARLDTLFEIGRDKGTNRAGLGPGEQAAYEQVRDWMLEAGLEVSFDAGGNLYGRLAGSRPELAEVWSGSHLDTPPDGGRFDGALGVVAALDASEAIRASGGAERTFAVVAFRLEEGPRFGAGCFGSRALCGLLEPGEGDLRDRDGISLAEAFAALGYGELPTESWLDPAPFAFIETHIEQGPLLAEQGERLGLVSSIASMLGMELEFSGRRGHAGTVPMDLRSDALATAARFVLDAFDAARAIPGAVATVGRLTVGPGATNTIPDRATLFIDLRAPDDAGLEQLRSRVEAAAHASASSNRCGVELGPPWVYVGHPMDELPKEALRRAMRALGSEPVELPSGAGHDAQILGQSGVPVAMLFVRSDAGGVSHAPEEHTGADALEACVRVLEPALRDLMRA